ncbi:MAG TPA: hypothetical protein VFY12_07925 [Arenimonas sp.]|nr:hypothetical protein [Arenimonas sp.]
MSAPRIERVERDGRVVWIKRYGKNGRRLRMAVLRWVARRLGANALLAPVPLSGEAACASELAMLRRLAALGVHVPGVIEARATELVLSDLGGVIPLLLRSGELSQRLQLLDAAIDALRDLHQRGGFASQAMARNLTWDGQRIGFIDLEEDPAQMMSVAAAQARDWLMFAYSMARYFTDALPQFRQRLADALQQEAPEIRNELFATVRGLRWLPSLARPFGRRAREVALGVEALVHIAAGR